MIVALDVTHLRQSRGGIARYIENLGRALRERGDATVVDIGAGAAEERGTLRKKLFTGWLDLAWYPALARREARAVRAQVLHCPAPRGPLTRGSPPVVMTIHDLVPFIFPETMTAWSRRYSRATHRRMAHAADRIICPSQNTADDVSNFLGVPEDRLRVIPLGVDRFFFATHAGRESEAVKTGPAANNSASELAIDVPYILFVGSQELRKNLGRLEDAVALLRAKGFPHQLVIAGGERWGPQRPDRDFVRRLGRVTETELRRLYTNAACVALPSLHEGFGLPALEAMASGAPVVAGRAGSLPEITGSAAVLVNPLDVADIEGGIESAIENRGRLQAAGLAHAAKYTWEKTAKATFDVYRELA